MTDLIVDVKTSLIVRPNLPNNYAVFKHIEEDKYSVLFEGTKDECYDYVQKEERKYRWAGNH